MYTRKARESEPRQPGRVASRKNEPWTREENATLQKYYANRRASWIAEQLNRTVYAVQQQAHRLGLKRLYRKFGDPEPNSK